MAPLLISPSSTSSPALRPLALARERDDGVAEDDQRRRDPVGVRDERAPDLGGGGFARVKAGASRWWRLRAATAARDGGSRSTICTGEGRSRNKKRPARSARWRERRGAEDEICIHFDRDCELNDLDRDAPISFLCNVAVGHLF
uniref:Uncharacterized protein n=1 Tax=Arundo donax TaxID=35708 RepID=A0A0A9GQ29_ARUDO